MGGKGFIGPDTASTTMVIHVKIHDHSKSTGRGKCEATHKNFTVVSDADDAKRGNDERNERSPAQTIHESRDQTPLAHRRRRSKSQTRSIQDRTPPYYSTDETQSSSRRSTTTRPRSRTPGRRDRSRSVVRDNTKTKSPAFRFLPNTNTNTNNRQKTPTRLAPAPPPKKTEYVPLNPEVLNTDLPSVTESKTSLSSQSSYVPAAHSRQSPYPTDSRRPPSAFPSATSRQTLAPPAPVRATSKQRQSTTPSQNLLQPCARPASPSISSYAKFSGKGAERTKLAKDNAAYLMISPTSPGIQSQGKNYTNDVILNHGVTQKSPDESRPSRRSVSLPPRDRMKVEPTVETQAKNNKAGRSWLSPRNNYHEEHKATQSKSEQGTRPWGLSLLRSNKTKAQEDKRFVHVLEYMDPVSKSESNDASDSPPSHDSTEYTDDFIDGDNPKEDGRGVQFFSNTVNNFDSNESESTELAAGDDKDLSEIIKMTELLEQKLGGVGDPSKPQMNPSEIGELISALSKLRAHATHLQGKRNYETLQSGKPVSGCLQREKGVGWLDSIAGAMFGHCEWNSNVVQRRLIKDVECNSTDGQSDTSHLIFDCSSKPEVSEG